MYLKYLIKQCSSSLGLFEIINESILSVVDISFTIEHLRTINYLKPIDLELSITTISCCIFDKTCRLFVRFKISPEEAASKKMLEIHFKVPKISRETRDTR